MARLNPLLRHATALVCAYEAFSIWTRRTPTLSELSKRYRWLAPTLEAALAYHLAEFLARLTPKDA